jgi:hypothetical protein
VALDELQHVPPLPEAASGVTQPPDHPGGRDAIGLVVVHDQDQGTVAKGGAGEGAVGHGASGFLMTGKPLATTRDRCLLI